MPDGIIVRGDAGAKEAPASGAVRRTRGETLRTLVVRGLAAEVEALVPDAGDDVEIGGVACRVVSAEYRPEKGGLATLTVQGRRKLVEGDDPEDPEATWEVEMAQIEKPVTAHPVFSGYANLIELWRNSPPETRSRLKYLDADGAERDLPGNAAKCASLLLKGVESYLVFAPVLRRVRSYEDGSRVAAGDGIGERGDPPAAGLAFVSGTWEWLKTADRLLSRDGAGAERTEDWTGADAWDPDLYAAASGGGGG